jgi:hypothetical protein
LPQSLPPDAKSGGDAMKRKRNSEKTTSRRQARTRKAGAVSARNSPRTSTSDAEADGEASAVGYGRPPLHSRFKPGQSGNPNGRPKRSSNMSTIVQKVLNESVPIREGGRLRRMSTMEALFRSILARAFKGDPKSMNSLMIMVKQSGYGTDHDESKPETLSGVDYEAILSDYVTRTSAAARAEPASTNDVKVTRTIPPSTEK